MKLCDKIIQLRKAKGWSQEDLAEKLNVSRQAVSRWETGVVLPDSNNILQLSKLFNVTADFLLNDEYASDGDIPCVKEAQQELDTKKKDYGKLSLIAAIAFCLAAVAWFAQAVNSSESIHFILAAGNAVLAGINGWIYVRNRA